MGNGRSPCCDNGRVKKGAWSPSEDLKLISFISNHGHPNWRALPKQAGLLRCGKSCRLRWINYLSPYVKRGNFTTDEEDTIIKLHQNLGNKWSKIASHLPGRTDNEIKNFYNTHLKRRLGLAAAPSKRGAKPRPKESKSKESSSGITSPASSSSTLGSGSGKGTGIQAGLQPWDEGSSLSSSSSSKKLRPQEEPKELSYNSSMSSSSHGDQSCLSADDIQFLLGLEEPFFTEVNKPENVSISSPPVPNVPMEFDSNFWNNLYLNNIGVPVPLVESNNVQSNEVGVETRKWLKYLESELGLDDSSTEEVNQENVANSDFESLLDSYLTELEMDMDPGL